MALAGLLLAARLTHGLVLRTHLRRLAALLGDQVAAARMAVEIMQFGDLRAEPGTDRSSDDPIPHTESSGY